MADDVCYGKRLLEIIAPEKTSLPDQESPDYGGLIFDGNFSDIKKLRHERQLEDAHETVRSLYLRSVDLYGQESDRYAPYSDNDGQDPPLNHGEQYNLDLDCRRPAWVKESFPTCNQVHEELLIERPFDSQMIFQDYIVSYLSSGDFRDAWKFQRYDADAENNSVLKRMKLADQFSWGQGGRDLFRIRQEAIILEKLTASPRIINIYGFCGTSVIMEAMASDLTKQLVKGNGIASQEMLNRLDDADISLNNFTASEKLQISLDMAMSLADLHGFKG